MPSTQSITVLSPAKLNLFLHIIGRRSDGYHELQTVFQLLNYGDTLTFTPSSDGHIHIEPDIAGLDIEDNLIYRAAQLLKPYAEVNCGIHIHIEKRTPMGGGLGGGSSNAATSLLVLNTLWETQLSLEKLASMGASLGADVPVFVYGRSAWAEGIGEKLKPMNLPKKWFLVIKPDCHVSTKEIFCSEELTRDTPAITVAAFLEQGGQNDCESVVCKHHPEVKQALDWLSSYQTARLTGTGACVFAEFETEKSAQQAQTKVPKKWLSFVAEGINCLPPVLV